MKSKMTVFLSYAREDTKVAGVLRAGLSKAGFEAWDPAERLMPGDNWALQLGKALQKADAMVVLLSPAAIASAHVQREIDYALGDERFKGRLLPVVVRSVKEIPWILEKLNLLRIESDPERESRRVVAALRRMQHAA